VTGGQVWSVPDALEGERVDRAVALLTGWTRSEVASLLARGAVSVDGTPVAKSRRLVAGEVVAVEGAPEVAGPPEPEVLPLTVVHEDDAVVVVDKPAGLVVHPGAGHASGTLVNALLARYPELATVGDPARPGIVHRLDRDTSGLLVVARRQAAYERLVEALAAHAVDRRYRALVWGIPESARGVVDAPVGRSTRSRTRMAVREGGKPARTAYRVEESFPDPGVALLRCTLETGRTHQIRVHLAAIRHPVVGDLTYGSARPALALARPFLHAQELAFAHPVTGEPLHFVSPLPPELEAVLDALRSARP
jgi:23S rRNA pseudouridine1911/1915/1917 synthase